MIETTIPDLIRIAVAGRADPAGAVLGALADADVHAHIRRAA